MRTYIAVPIAILIVFPLSLIKNMHGFRYLSVAAFVGIFYTLVVLLIQLPAYIRKNYS